MMIKVIEKLMMKIFKEHQELFGKVQSTEYLEDNIRIYVHEYKDNISIVGLNDKSQREINFTAKKYSKLFDEYRKIGIVENDYLKKSVRISFNYIEKKPKVIGYCRVSTKGQLENNSLQQQEEIILVKYPNAKIEKEQFTGVVSDRPILNRVVSKVSKGDTLVVSKLDRLARNTKDGIEIIEQLFSKGVAVHVLNVGLLEDTTMGKFFLTTMLAVAEMERNMIIERTQAGKEIARTKVGFKEGRPKKFKDVNIKHALSLLTINGGNMSYTEVVNITAISKSTLIRENNKRK